MENCQTCDTFQTRQRWFYYWSQLHIYASLWQNSYFVSFIPIRRLIDVYVFVFSLSFSSDFICLLACSPVSSSCTIKIHKTKWVVTVANLFSLSLCIAYVNVVCRKQLLFHSSSNTKAIDEISSWVKRTIHWTFMFHRMFNVNECERREIKREN